MGESWGVAWLLWILVLGASGFALGSIVVFTASAPMSMRVVAAASMVAAFFIAVGLNVVGLLSPAYSLPGVFLAPLVVAIGLRSHWSRAGRTESPKRD
ncbi:MAG: hypothetical protein IPG84_18060 [Betaproteobacteria bacterium]|jgi:hypothetical protein|nr:hypothetical protein [Betaproteobacteria bacterium]